jgi:hypothetical protein
MPEALGDVADVGTTVEHERRCRMAEEGAGAGNRNCSTAQGTVREEPSSTWSSSESLQPRLTTTRRHPGRAAPGRQPARGRSLRHGRRCRSRTSGGSACTRVIPMALVAAWPWANGKDCAASFAVLHWLPDPTNAPVLADARSGPEKPTGKRPRDHAGPRQGVPLQSCSKKLAAGWDRVLDHRMGWSQGSSHGE